VGDLGLVGAEVEERLLIAIFSVVQVCAWISVSNLRAFGVQIRRGMGRINECHLLDFMTLLEVLGRVKTSSSSSSTMGESAFRLRETGVLRDGG
jgi:hypothetical protein